MSIIRHFADDNNQAYQSHYLYPAALFVHRSPHKITTILGSCVAVCLWDSVLGFGGMNHFMLPWWNGEGLASPKYGNIAMEKLLYKMQEMGSHKQYLQAKVFGGAQQLTKAGNNTLKIGDRNIEVAVHFLKEQGIPIKAINVGKNLGRKIIYQTDKGHVLMKLINK